MQTYNPNRKKEFIITGLIILAVFIAFIFFSSLKLIGVGERGVVFNALTGIEERNLGEGVHIVFPVVQTVTTYNIKKQPVLLSKSESITSLTFDGQEVIMDLSLIYNINRDYVWKLHQDIGKSYRENVIKPIIRSAVRNVTASYTAEKVYSGTRKQLEADILESVRTELAKYYIQVDEVLIRDINFSQEFAKAIEQKQVAFQESERMKYILQKEVQEKQRKIIEAEGDAAAIQKKGLVLKQYPQLIQYDYVKKISPNVRTIITNQKSIMSFPEGLLK